jgi:Uma2 family endonuclease
MGLAQPKTWFSPEDYLAFEREAQTKHEYLDGEIYAMAGGRSQHNQIGFNVTGEFRQQLKGRNCRGYTADQKVRSDPQGMFSYLNITIVCGEPVFHDQQQDVVLNPTVIIEVLSPTTEAYDRTEKFARYRTISSLRDYLLIAQDRPCIEHFMRQKGKRQWLYNIEAELTSSIWIESIKCELKLADVYDLIEFLPPRPLLLVETLPAPAAKKTKPKKAKKNSLSALAACPP